MHRAFYAFFFCIIIEEKFEYILLMDETAKVCKDFDFIIDKK